MTNKRVEEITYDAENKLRELRSIWQEYPTEGADQTFFRLVYNQIDDLLISVWLTRKHQ